MKILMVGHSRSGKTSYMSGLYHLYGDDPKGFGLWMSNSSKKANLKRLGDQISNGRYPSGTDISSVYNFWLQYDNELLIPVDWYDYRGGALSETSNISKDAQALVSQISTADALIVFLDGEKITKMTDDDLEEEYDVLIWAIQKSISNRASKGHYFPISFVITKGDLYSTYDPLYGSAGLNYFMPIITTIRESQVAAGMIGVVEVSMEGIHNVFAPLIFSLYYGMHHYEEERIRNAKEEIEKYKNLYPNIFDDIWSAFWGKDSDRAKARKCIDNYNEEIEKLKTLDSLSEVMNKMLEMFCEKNMIIKF